MKNKIIIQSDSDDRSSDDVISWLSYLNPTISISTFFNKCPVENFDLTLTNANAQIEINKKIIKQIDTFWYRRGEFSFSKKEVLSDLIKKAQSENLRPLIDFINYGFNRKSINKFQDNKIEKLEMLFLCHKLKIPFPETIVSNKKNRILSFLKKHKKIISKGIKYPNIMANFKEDNVQLASSTLLIDNETDITRAKPFAPSLFQEYIEKQLEIRSFYLKGKFRSMAIFSQQNEQTKIDYRNYDYTKPNRLVPFQLPAAYERKLNELMKALKLNSGSFDIIYTPKGEYYFLEVNPIGQFQWLSSNCNYYLEKMIAKKLLT